MTVSPPPDAGSPRADRDLVVMAAGFAATAIAALTLAGPAAVGLAAGAAWPDLATLAMLGLAGAGLRAARWHVVAWHLGLSAGYLRDGLMHAASGALPSSARRRRDRLRLGWVQVETGAPARDIVPLILLDRGLDRAALAALLIAALLLWASEAAGLWVVGLAAAAACALGAVRGAPAACARALERLSEALPGPSLRLRSVLVPLARMRGRPLPLVALGLAGLAWLVEAMVLGLLLAPLAVVEGTGPTVALALSSALVGRLCGGPGGVVAAEIALIVLLILAGVGPAQAVAVTLIHRAVTLGLPTALGLVLYPLVDRMVGRHAG